MIGSGRRGRRGCSVPPGCRRSSIRLPDGRWLVVDFLLRAPRAVLEIDSDEHHSSPGDADATHDPHLALETLGLSVVHRRPYVITHRPTEFVAGLRSWLAARAAQLSIP
jgi:very-short-patch-repair endonuclease